MFSKLKLIWQIHQCFAPPIFCAIQLVHALQFTCLQPVRARLFPHVCIKLKLSCTICLSKPVHVHTLMHKQLHMHIHTHIHTHLYTHTPTNKMHTHTNAHSPTHTHTHAHIHHIHTPTNKHAQT